MARRGHFISSILCCGPKRTVGATSSSLLPPNVSLNSVTVSMSSSKNFSSIPRDKPFSNRSAALENLEDHCTGHDSDGSYGRDEVCLDQLVKSVHAIIGITLVSDIDPEIAPSITGLGNLFRLWANPNHKDQQTVFDTFSGLFIDSEEQALALSRSDNLAMAGAGVCVYRRAVVEPALATRFNFQISSKFRIHYSRWSDLQEDWKFLWPARPLIFLG